MSQGFGLGGGGGGQKFNFRNTYQAGFSFGPLGHAPGVGLGGTVGGWGVKKLFFPNSTRFDVWVAYINDTCNSAIFWSPPPRALGRGQKVKYH